METLAHSPKAWKEDPKAWKEDIVNSALPNRLNDKLADVCGRIVVAERLFCAIGKCQFMRSNTRDSADSAKN